MNSNSLGSSPAHHIFDLVSHHTDANVKALSQHENSYQGIFGGHYYRASFAKANQTHLNTVQSTISDQYPNFAQLLKEEGYFSSHGWWRSWFGGNKALHEENLIALAQTSKGKEALEKDLESQINSVSLWLDNQLSSNSYEEDSPESKAFFEKFPHIKKILDEIVGNITSEQHESFKKDSKARDDFIRGMVKGEDFFTYGTTSSTSLESQTHLVSSWLDNQLSSNSHKEDSSEIKAFFKKFPRIKATLDEIVGNITSEQRKSFKEDSKARDDFIRGKIWDENVLIYKLKNQKDKLSLAKELEEKLVAFAKTFAKKVAKIWLPGNETKKVAELKRLFLEGGSLNGIKWDGLSSDVRTMADHVYRSPRSTTFLEQTFQGISRGWEASYFTDEGRVLGPDSKNNRVEAFQEAYDAGTS